LVNDTTTPGSIMAFREGGTRPYVKAVRPRPGSIDAPATNGIEIAIADGTLPVQGDGIRLFLNDQPVDPLVNKVGGTTTVTYTPRAGLAPESTNVVRLIYEDTAAPAHVMTNEFSFVVAPDYDLLVGIDPASIWRYHASALDPGVAWKETSYDDSSWPSGAALFEGKSGTVPDLPEPVRTVLTIDSTITAYYFRTHFAFAGNPGGARLRMRHIIDDGAVFYLNGAEIYRVGMSVGAVTISTLADRSVGNADYEGPVDLPARSLVAGDNVLALEVHQASSTSSDATMGVQLISITSNPLRTTIASVSPAPGAADVPPDSAIEIVLGDGTQKVEPGSIQLFVNDQPVTFAVNKPAGSPWTTIRYQPAQFLPENTPITVKLVFNDDATPPSVTTREFGFTTAPEITALVAIDDKQLWRYNDTGQDPGPMWKEPGFDDSSWKSGAALFEGKKATVPALPEPVRTMLTVATNKTAFYFRTHFTFTGDPAATQLKIRSIIDDGAVFYLNGAEVFRLGMPEGPINASTLASRSLVDADYEGPFDVPSSPLRAGDNVLAVEVHQTSPTSSDITMGVQLMVPGVPPAELPAFSRVSLVGTNLQIEWLGSGQLQSSDAVTGPWTNVMNAASPFTATTVGAARFYRLRQ